MIDTFTRTLLRSLLFGCVVNFGTVSTLAMNEPSARVAEVTIGIWLATIALTCVMLLTVIGWRTPRP